MLIIDVVKQKHNYSVLVAIAVYVFLEKADGMWKWGISQMKNKGKHAQRSFSLPFPLHLLPTYSPSPINLVSCQ